MESLRQVFHTLNETESGINSLHHTYDGGPLANDDDDSFEVSEVTDAATSDINLADALNSLQTQPHWSNETSQPEIHTFRPVNCLQPTYSLQSSISETSSSSSSSSDSSAFLRSLKRAASIRDDTKSPGSEVNCDIKNELRTKIQTRRISQGVGELRVEFEAPKTYKLTPEEEKKVQNRKHRNRLSANKSRLRRMQHEEELRKEADTLEAENDRLRSEIKLFQKLKTILSKKMESHTCERTVPKQTEGR